MDVSLAVLVALTLRDRWLGCLRFRVFPRLPFPLLGMVVGRILLLKPGVYSQRTTLVLLFLDLRVGLDNLSSPWPPVDAKSSLCK